MTPRARRVCSRTSQYVVKEKTLQAWGLRIERVEDEVQEHHLHLSFGKLI